MGVFDEILKRHVTDEADRAVIAKYSGLQEAMETIASTNERNQEWFRQRYDFDAQKTKRELEYEAALAEKETLLAAAAAGGNTEMTFEQIEANLKTKGYISKAEVDKQIADARNGVEQVIAQRDLGAMIFTGNVANLARKHHEEFGSDLDVNGFAQHVVNSGAKDPVTAYDQFVATKRAEKTRQELETLKTNSQVEIEKVKTEALEAGRRQGMMEAAQQTGGGMPVDQGHGGSGMGWMQRRSLERTQRVDADGNQQVPDGKLGDGSTTAAILAQYRKDKAEGKVLTM